MLSKIKGWILDATNFAQISLILAAYGAGRWLKLPKIPGIFGLIPAAMLVCAVICSVFVQYISFARERQRTAKMAEQFDQTKKDVESLKDKLHKAEARAPGDLMPYGDYC